MITKPTKIDLNVSDDGQRHQLPDIYTIFPDLQNMPNKMMIEMPNKKSCSDNIEQKNTISTTKKHESTNDPEIFPAELGFIPHSNWCKKMIKFSKLQRLYFQRRKGHARRFDYKLYNALLITKKDKNMFNLVGAMWVTADIIKINSEIFAQLIGINTIQGGLFHKQGNFPRNGFIHIYKNSSQELIDNPDCVDVDEHNVRLFIDKYRRFTRDKDYVVFEDIIIP